MKFNFSTEKSVLAVVMTTSFLSPFIGSAINLAVPAIGTELGGSASMLSWVVTSFLLSSAVLLLPFGRIADIIGRKKIFIAGIILFFLSSLACGAAWSTNALIFFRACQGIGGSMIFGTGIAILTAVYPAHSRGQALGLTAAATYAGLSLGPVLGGFMNHNLGWRSIFFLTSLVSGIAAVMAIWRLKGEWADSKGEKFDINGSLCYVFSLTVVLYSLSALSTQTWAKYTLLLGLALLTIFIWYESGLNYPIINISLFKNNLAFSAANLAAMINYSATFAVGFLLSLHLQLIMGYNSQLSGFILLTQPVIMALFSPIAGTASDKLEPRIVSSAGMALSSLGLFLFIFLSANTPIWLIAVNLALVGFGFALFASPNNNAIMSSVDSKYYGLAASSLATMRMIGQAVSMAIVTLIISIYVSGGLTEKNAAVFIKVNHTIFIIFTIICIVGVFASLARAKTANQPKA